MPMPLPEGLVEMDHDRGIIRIKGRRFWLGEAFDFVSLYQVLESLMGKGATAAVYREGEQTANAYFKTIRTVLADRFEGAEPRHAFEVCLDFFRLIGYGRFEVVRWDEKAIRVRLYDSIAAEAYGPSKRGSCTSLAGLLASLLQAVYRVDGESAEFVCREIRCASTGAEWCEFIASRDSL